MRLEHSVKKSYYLAGKLVDLSSVVSLGDPVIRSIVLVLGNRVARVRWGGEAVEGVELVVREKGIAKTLSLLFAVIPVANFLPQCTAR